MRHVLRTTKLLPLFLAALAFGIAWPVDDAHAQRTRTEERPAPIVGRGAAKLKQPTATKARSAQSKLAALKPSKLLQPGNLSDTSRTRTIAHDQGATKFLAPRANVNKEVQKLAEKRGQKGELLYLIFAGGAGATTPKDVEQQTRAVARAYAEQYKKGKFGKYTVVVSTGAAPGLPDIAVDEFRKVAPDVVTVGYGPTKSPKQHIKAGAPYKNLDVVVMTEPTPHTVAATAKDPDYMGREIRMIDSQDAPAILVTMGGRFGTASEAAMALDAGKAVAFSRGTGGVSDMFDDVVKSSTKAGKPPRAPVVVSPNFDLSRPDNVDKFARAYAERSVDQTMKRLAQGEMSGHIEQGSGSVTKLDRMSYVRAPGFGKMDAQFDADLQASAREGSLYAKGQVALRDFGEFFKVDVVGKDDATRVRLNTAQVKKALKASGRTDISVDDVKQGWATVQKAMKNVQEKDLAHKPNYQPLRIGVVGRDRPHITRLSLADPGPEHTAITVMDPDIVSRGVVVHNEFINRENLFVEPYRPPDGVQTKLNVFGAAGRAPVSVYYGLPNFDENLDGAFGDAKSWQAANTSPEDVRKMLRKPAVSVADFANSRFDSGAAEVKLRLSPTQMPRASQMVMFMSEVNEQIGRHGRDPNQVVSAQFNLNEPLIDDLPGGSGKLVKGPLEVAKLSQRVMKEVSAQTERDTAKLPARLRYKNAFLKWAPDAAFKEPSMRVPFIELLGGMKPGQTLTPEQRQAAQRRGTKHLVRLVADVNAMGMDAYISGGMTEEHMKAATYANADVGIGTAMHDRTTVQGKSIMGRLSPKNIKAALDIRDQAEKSTLGKGAARLYQLSFKMANGKLDAASAKERTELLDAMSDLDETRVSRMLGRK